jgi:hypothetical protein
MGHLIDGSAETYDSTMYSPTYSPLGAKEGGEDLAVDREVGLVLQPLNRRASSAVSPGLGVGALGGVPTRSLRR